MKALVNNQLYHYWNFNHEIAIILIFLICFKSAQIFIKNVLETIIALMQKKWIKILENFKYVFIKLKRFFFNEQKKENEYAMLIYLILNKTNQEDIKKKMKHQKLPNLKHNFCKSKIHSKNC